MRTGSKRLLALFAAFLAVIGSAGLPERAFGNGVASGAIPSGGDACGGGFLNFGSFIQRPMEDLKKVGQVACTSPKYQEEGATVLNECKACQSTVNKWKEQLPKAAEAARKADCAAANAGSLLSGGTIANNGDQLSTFGNNRTNVRAGQRTQTTRADNATKAKSEFDKCKEEVEKSCRGKRLTDQDQNVAKAVIEACTDGGKKAGDFANQKKNDGNGLGDLSKLMDAASKAMGPLAQMAQQQNQPSDMSGLAQPPATSPTPASPTSASSTPEIQTTKFEGKDGTSTPAIGFGDLAKPSTIAAVQTGITGVGSGTGASSGPEHFGGSGSNSLGGSPEGNGVGASSAGAGGGAGGGGLNSSGSSRPGEGSVAGGGSGGEGAGGFEMNPGGGKAFVGLKPSKADADSIADGSILGKDGLPAEDLGGRDLASEGAGIDAGQGDNPQLEGDSVFMRVRAKYSALKGSGRI